MRINKAGYNSLDWTAALSSSKQPIKDQEVHALSQIGKGENIENALEKAAEAAFSVPSKEMSNAEAIAMAGKSIQDDRAKNAILAKVGDIREKLANHSVDPISLGVASKEEWDKCSDPEVAEKIAKAAIEKQIKNQKNAWQDRAMVPVQHNMAFDPKSSKSGKISSTASQNEDSAPIVIRDTPRNAPSIFDPFKLDRFAAEDNEHDQGVKANRDAAKAKEGASRDWRGEEHVIPNDFSPLNGGAIQRSGGKDASVFSSKVPKNQVSMMDDISAKSPEEAKEKMKKLFEGKVSDNRQQIRESNKERSDSIHRNVEKDKTWEKVGKPLSTKDMQTRLMNLWMPPAPEK